MLGPLNSLFFFSRPIWRMHLGVEVTELSTNKQHYLSRMSSTLPPPREQLCNRSCSPPATETQGHGPGLHPARGDEQPRRAGRQRQGPRALLEAPLMARSHQAHPPTMPSTQRSGRCLSPRSPSLPPFPRLHNSPLAKCGCKKFCMDFHGDHTSTCTAHSGATKRTTGW